MKIYSYDVKKKKRVLAGETRGTAFIKKVDRKKHYLWSIHGYAISTDAIKQIKDGKVVKEIIFLEDEINELSITLNDFLMKALNINLGHGPQLAIEERHLKDEANRPV